MARYIVRLRLIYRVKLLAISILFLGLLGIAYQFSYISSLPQKDAFGTIEIFANSEGGKLPKGVINIAVGGGITGYTGKGKGVNSYLQVPPEMEFMKTLLPSFCETCSNGYHYHFYLAYDYNDFFFSNSSNRAEFIKYGFEIVDRLCTNTSHYSIQFVKCGHSKSPAWAQNDAMYEAYLDGADYFYRINDDTIMQTKGWTEAFIHTLGGYHPPNVGVVGPDQNNRNEPMLTYDFTHKTHIDIFGWYYPRAFHAWWADAWISDVYKPGRYTKMKNITLVHSKLHGTRYASNFRDRKKLACPLEEGKTWLQRYLKYKSTNTEVRSEGSKAISISLFGNHSRYLTGAIRNAQLAPIIYPGWHLRVYVLSRHVCHDMLPKRILRKLKELGAHVYIVPDTIRLPDPRYMRYLVADDPTVDVFIIRDADTRLSVREKDSVDMWLSSNQTFHFMNDHPKYFTSLVPEGLWGARRKGLFRNMLNYNSMEDIITNAAHMDILSHAIWPAVKGDALCHRYGIKQETKLPDKNSLELFPCQTVLTQRGITCQQRFLYVGQKFNQYDELVSSDDPMGTIQIA